MLSIFFEANELAQIFGKMNLGAKTKRRFKEYRGISDICTLRGGGVAEMSANIQCFYDLNPNPPVNCVMTFFKLFLKKLLNISFLMLIRYDFDFIHSLQFPQNTKQNLHANMDPLLLVRDILGRGGLTLWYILQNGRSVWTPWR